MKRRAQSVIDYKVFFRQVFDPSLKKKKKKKKTPFDLDGAADTVGDNKAEEEEKVEEEEEIDLENFGKKKKKKKKPVDLEGDDGDEKADAEGERHTYVVDIEIYNRYSLRMCMTFSSS